MRKKIFTFLLALVTSVGLSWATTTDLASITGDYTAQDGEILTGTLGVNVKISIADGATVTLLNANINGDKTWTTGEYAGLTCLGDATITIVGKNSVSGFSVDNGYPGIYIPSGKTLIINGTGSLTAQSSTEEAAGIGARKNTHCGNIEIQSGKITAIAGGEEGAGIGGGFNGNCGNITISGGIVTAVGGYRGAGIGGGRRSGSTNAGHCGNILISGGVVSATSGEEAAAIGGGRGNNNNYKTNCGTITITNTALKVYAHQGGGSTNTIGAGKYGTCGTVTIGGNTGVINNDPYTYRTKEDGEIVVDYINAIGTVVYTQECKDKIDIARELYDALGDSQKDLVTNYQTLLDAEAAYAALIPSGSCGDNLTWEFNTETGALTISGTGAMNDYSWDPNAAPWYAYKDAITSVSFPEGITTIGAYAFVNCDNAAFTTVTIPEGVITLGVNAFYNCDGIQEITIPSTVTTIEVGAIYDCKAVNSITSYIASPTSLHGYAIYGYKNTCTLYVPYNSIADYQAADCWKYIPNIAAIPGTEPASSDEHITANEDPKNTGVYYSTFFDSANKYALPTGVEAYVAEVSSNALNLTKIAGEGQTIPADNAVILRSTVAGFTLAVSDAAPVSFTATNNLHGVDADTEIADVVSGTCYVLSGNSTDGVGFFVYKAPNQLKAHKAYIDLNGSGMAQAPKRMPFVFNGEQTATGVENVQGDKVQSTKVIENGVLYIIKNGVKYNVQGQEVK